MHLRGDWEWDELVYHHYWVNVWPIVERIERENHGSVEEWGGDAGSGDASVLALTTHLWTSFRRTVIDFRRGVMVRVLSWCGTHLLITASAMSVIKGSIDLCFVNPVK